VLGIAAPGVLTVVLVANGRLGAARAEQHQIAAIVGMYGAEVAASLRACPYPLAAVAVVTLALLPVLTLVAGWDVLSRDWSSGRLRFEATRAPRWALLVGRSAGVWLSLTLLIALTHVPVWLALLTRSSATDAHAIVRWGAVLALVCVVAAIAYSAIVGFVSVWFRSSVYAFVAASFVLLLASVATREHVLPGGLSSWILPLSDEGVLLSMGRPGVVTGVQIVTWSAVLLCVSACAFARRPVC
jgi:hypothetical protein